MKVVNLFQKLWKEIIWKFSSEYLVVEISVAEMIKYVSNSWHALGYFFTK